MHPDFDFASFVLDEDTSARAFVYAADGICRDSVILIGLMKISLWAIHVFSVLIFFR